MISRTVKAIVFASLAISTNAVFKGVARIHSTAAAGDGVKITGDLIFTATKVGGKNVMKVEGTLNGIPDGIHGFHVHQYGDESTTPEGKNRYGAHFVPKCKSLPDPDCNPVMGGPCVPKEDKCKKMEVHGLPPDDRRQSGDMGNIRVIGGQATSLPGSLLEAKIFEQDKMSFDGGDQSVLGRAVAIHQYQDIGREIPLHDGLCEKTCKVKPSGVDKAPPGRTCAQTDGNVKLADIAILQSDQYTVKAATAGDLSVGDVKSKNVVARYPTLDKDVYYRITNVISVPSNTATGDYKLKFNNANACARRISANYLTSGGADPLQKSDPFGAAGPAIAGGVIGRMNPNQASDGLTSTGVTDDTKPSEGVTQISCYLRATADAGDSKIEGEALIVQKVGTKNVNVQVKLYHGVNMAGKTYSFHFHEYGDLRELSPDKDGNRRVGKIYKEDNPDDILKLKTLEIPSGKTVTYRDYTYTLPGKIQGVEEYVGRSLTIHKGETKTTPTVSYGVCGIANPDSFDKFYPTTEVVFEKEEKTASNAVALGLSAASLVAALFW